MKHFVTVKLLDSEGVVHEKTLYVSFWKLENTYGNKHYVSIEDKHGFKLCYDLRYDESFHSNNKEAWLRSWINWYWSGKDGAWKAIDIEIKEFQEETV